VTRVEIRGDDFWIDGSPTYAGRTWSEHRVEGLLLNARMVQATFDDRNAETKARWVYPDTDQWDPERNVREFVSMLPRYRQHGLRAVTVNFQGGSPEGYSREQPWENSAFEANGSLRSDYSDRMRQVIEAADACGMSVIVGYFYQGQDERLHDETAVIRAVDEATRFLLEHAWRNVLVEVNNECDTRYEHPILQPQRVDELIQRVQSASERTLLVSTSYRGGGRIPDPNVLRVADFVLLHGNGTHDPSRIADQVDRTRAAAGFRGQPIVFNEDDHFDFEQPTNNMLAALGRHASWGFFDPGEGVSGRSATGNYRDGYQLVPVNWTVNTPRKRAFFDLLEEVTTA
jgi:hypothetical protein